ncbi:hypothetical protein NLM25_09680 [Bradyrhizobium sp. CCGB01]|nr:hypothetical protein [Bradyrhizobium sp. CCGB01]MCP3405816.1 hypothetical protein [Bradyrhizobium sp. CCGB01]
MGEVVRLVTKAERERARLIREARANYEAVFPPVDPGGEQPVKPYADRADSNASPNRPRGLS